MSLIVGESLVPTFWENFPQPHLIIIRECSQNNIIHILRYFNDFSDYLYLGQLHPLSPHISSSTLAIIKVKGVYAEFLCKNSSADDSLSSLLVSICQSFFLVQKTYLFKCTEVFLREIQPHQMVKSLSESVVVL